MPLVSSVTVRRLVALCLGATVVLAAFVGCGEDELAGGASPVATQSTAVGTVPTSVLPSPPSAVVPTNTATPIVTPEPTEPGEEPPPDPANETPLPTPRPTDPLITSITFDYADPASAEVLVELYELIVMGRVVEILPAQWSTQDGTRPPNPHESVPRESVILTPIVVELDGEPIVDRVPDWVPFDRHAGRIVLAAWGGQVEYEGGVDSMTVNAWESQYRVGDEVLVALSSSSGRRHMMPSTPAGPAWWIGATYQIQDGDIAVTTSGGGPVSTSVEELIASIRVADGVVPVSTAVASPTAAP